MAAEPRRTWHVLHFPIHLLPKDLRDIRGKDGHRYNLHASCLQILRHKECWLARLLLSLAAEDCHSLCFQRQLRGQGCKKCTMQDGAGDECVSAGLHA